MHHPKLQKIPKPTVEQDRPPQNNHTIQAVCDNGDPLKISVEPTTTISPTHEELYGKSLQTFQS